MSSKFEKGAVAVVGVGVGLGAALAVRFATDYKVALIARSGIVTHRYCDQKEVRSVQH